MVNRLYIPPDYTPAKVRRRQSKLGSGVFRCDRCDRVLPESDLVQQDGLRLCRTLCRDNTSRSELDEILAEEMSAVDSMEPVEFPPDGATNGSVGVTAWSVRPLVLEDGGASEELILTGVNFTSSTTIEYGDAGITDATTPVVTPTSITLDVAASGVAVGYYPITIEGHKYWRAIRVL